MQCLPLDFGHKLQFILPAKTRIIKQALSLINSLFISRHLNSLLDEEFPLPDQVEILGTLALSYQYLRLNAGDWLHICTEIELF